MTPTSYLELIIAYQTSLEQKRADVSAAKKRYDVGLEKLEFAASQVAAMQKELTDLQPVLAQSQKDTDALMVQIQEKLQVLKKPERMSRLTQTWPVRPTAFPESSKSARTICRLQCPF